MKLEFDGKVVVVTGAAHGFGREIALRFAQLGARVHAWDVLREELEETAELAERHAHGADAEEGEGAVIPAYVDVTDPGQVEEAIESLLSLRPKPPPIRVRWRRPCRWWNMGAPTARSTFW